jgi:hypothetical protein
MVDLFDRALKLYLAAWLDFDLVTAGEMAALAALEHSLRDCYLGDFRDRHNKKVVARAKNEKRLPKLEENFQRRQLAAWFAQVDLNEPAFKPWGRVRT